MFCGDVDGPALVRVIAGPFAGDHDVHAVVAENALQLDDVSQPRDIGEDQGVLGQQTRDHQGKCRVLGARNRNCTVQTLSANYAYPVHAHPVRSSRSGYDGRDIETRAPLPQCQYWKASTFVAELRRKSGSTPGIQCSSRTAKFAFDCSRVPDGPVRPRSCALRFRRFSRNSTARRWLRPDRFADLLSFSSDVMEPHYRISGQRCNLRHSPCACESPMAVSAAFAPRHLGCERSCCRSSVVEHPLGKGEVECSIHSGSTRKAQPTLHAMPVAGFLGIRLRRELFAWPVAVRALKQNDG